MACWLHDVPNLIASIMLSRCTFISTWVTPDLSVQVPMLSMPDLFKALCILVLRLNTKLMFLAECIFCIETTYLEELSLNINVLSVLVLAAFTMDCTKLVFIAFISFEFNAVLISTGLTAASRDLLLEAFRYLAIVTSTDSVVW